jgi:hypothetical protein
MATENEGPRDGAERELSEKQERALEELTRLTGHNVDRFREQGLTNADMMRLAERTIHGLKQQGLSDADLIRMAGVTAEHIAMIRKLQEKYDLSAPTVGKRHPYWRKGLAQGVHYAYLFGGHHILYNWPDRGRLDTLEGRADFALYADEMLVMLLNRVGSFPWNPSDYHPHCYPPNVWGDPALPADGAGVVLTLARTESRDGVVHEVREVVLGHEFSCRLVQEIRRLWQTRYDADAYQAHMRRIDDPSLDPGEVARRLLAQAQVEWATRG